MNRSTPPHAPNALFGPKGRSKRTYAPYAPPLYVYRGALGAWRYLESSVLRPLPGEGRSTLQSWPQPYTPEAAA